MWYFQKPRHDGIILIERRAIVIQRCPYSLVNKSISFKNLQLLVMLTLNDIYCKLWRILCFKGFLCREQCRKIYWSLDLIISILYCQRHLLFGHGYHNILREVMYNSYHSLMILMQPFNSVDNYLIDFFYRIYPQRVEFPNCQCVILQ